MSSLLSQACHVIRMAPKQSRRTPAGEMPNQEDTQHQHWDLVENHFTALEHATGSSASKNHKNKRTQLQANPCTCTFGVERLSVTFNP
jgi:hypothetical protein